MASADQRYQQIGHGFLRLMAVTRVSSGWRKSVPGEQPDAIVSRVFGPDNFAIVTSGEIDRLDGFTPGDLLGVVLGQPIAKNGAPTVAKVVAPDKIVVNLQSYSGQTDNSSSSASLVALLAQITTVSNDVATLETNTTASDANLQTQITALNTALAAVNIANARQYAWSVAS